MKKQETIQSNELNRKVFRHDLHIELWDWLSKNLDKDKTDWPRWERNGGEILDIDDYFDCFSCHFSNHQEYDLDSSKCKNCPFGDFKWNNCLDGLYSNYASMSRFNVYNRPDKEKLALVIRDMPLREDWEWVDVVVKD